MTHKEKVIEEIEKAQRNNSSHLFLELIVQDWLLDVMVKMPNTEPSCDDVKDAYEQGMKDAWELAKTLYDKKCEEIEKIFDVEGGFWSVIRDFTPQDALVKLKAYEEAQEIKEGDIVDIFGNRAVVTSFGTDNMIIHVVYDDGITNSYRKDRKDIKKTGKHIDIQSILEQIGGE